jgi:hypothetical protein
MVVSFASILKSLTLWIARLILLNLITAGSVDLMKIITVYCGNIFPNNHHWIR